MSPFNILSFIFLLFNSGLAQSSSLVAENENQTHPPAVSPETFITSTINIATSNDTLVTKTLIATLTRIDTLVIYSSATVTTESSGIATSTSFVTVTSTYAQKFYSGVSKIDLSACIVVQCLMICLLLSIWSISQ